MMKKRLPIGISDYKKLIDDNCYYIDKTLFIDDILRYGGDVTLLPRPRRFGKTLNLSMLKYFFEKTENSNAYLFEDKKIWQLPECAALQGKFPVIFLTFKDIKETTWQITKNKLITVIAAEYERHKYLCDSDILSENEKNIFRKISSKTASDDEYHNSLKNLSEFLYRYYGARPFVLLDEYDAPIHAGFLHDYYTEALQFIRSLMGSVFKDNSYLERGIITGIFRTAKENFFSGLNNIEVFTIIDDFMPDKFGFTQQEVDQLLQDYDLSAISQEFKEWYNGYLIGSTKIYNPWSALSCVKWKGAFTPYWMDTSNNALIHKIMAQSSSDFKQECAHLMAGKTVEKVAIIADEVCKNNMSSTNMAWSLLLLNGYVTLHAPIRMIEGVKYADLVLPNNESHIIFQKLIENSFYKSLKSISESGYSLPAGALAQEGWIWHRCA